MTITLPTWLGVWSMVLLTLGILTVLARWYESRKYLDCCECCCGDDDDDYGSSNPLVGQTFTKEGNPTMYQMQCTTEEGVKVTLTPTTKGGNPAKVEDFSLVSVDGEGTFDPAECTYDHDNKVYTMSFRSGANPGTTTFVVRHDKHVEEPGEEEVVNPVDETYILEVSTPEAVNLNPTHETFLK